jgi:hypothetical protein
MSSPRVPKRAWAVSAYLAVCTACVGLGLFSTWQIHSREAAAHWIDGQLKNQEQSYAATLQGRYGDDEMESFRERRTLLSSAATWFQVRIGCIMLLVLASFAFYIQRAIASLSEEITDPIR